MVSMFSDAAQTAMAVCLAGLVGACGIAAKVNARNDMEASKVAYKTCLAQNPQGISGCEAAHEAYEADLAAYRATSAGIRSGAAFTVEQPASAILPPQPPPEPMFHPCVPLGPMMTVCQ